MHQEFVNKDIWENFTSNILRTLFYDSITYLPLLLRGWVACSLVLGEVEVPAHFQNLNFKK